MILHSFFAVLLLLWSLVLATENTSYETRSNGADYNCLISVSLAVSKRQAAIELNSTIDATNDWAVYKVQRSAWGDLHGVSEEQLSAAKAVEDGRMWIDDAVGVEEEDAEEEKEIAAEEKMLDAQKQAQTSSGSAYYDLSPMMLPLMPRVRGLNGCLLEGPPLRHAVPQGFSAVFIINLDSRPDRWAWITNTSGLIPLGEYRRKAAVHLRNMDEVQQLEGPRREIVMDKVNRTCQTPEECVLLRRRDAPDLVQRAIYWAKLGCYMSHLETVNTLAQFGHPPGHIYLVMEDDWELKRDLGGMLPDISWAVGHAWDAIRLDCWGGHGGWGDHDGRPVYRTPKRSWHYGGSHAILYRSESIAKVADYFLNEPFREADASFWTDKIETYCVNWGIVQRMALGSNIPHPQNRPRPDKDLLEPVGETGTADEEPIDATETADEEPIDATETADVKLVDATETADVEPVDAYVIYQQRARHQRSHRKKKNKQKSGKQLREQRHEHAKRCRKERHRKRLRLRELIKPSQTTRA